MNTTKQNKECIDDGGECIFCGEYLVADLCDCIKQKFADDWYEEHKPWGERVQSKDSHED